MHTDIATKSFINTLPKRFRPYAYLARLDRPIGWWLLLLPGLWAIALAGGGFAEMGAREFRLALLFFIGAIIMRAAGCVINDLWDRNLDKAVERTKSRPLAAGHVSMRGAFIFLLFLLMLGLAILLSMNALTIILGLIALPFVIIYPLMKRITFWPQLFLGLTFNFSALMGWAAVTGSLSFPVFLLYLGGLLWTMGYDTVYAHQDKEDDVLIGIKSTAIKFGEKSKFWVGGFYALSFLLLLAAQLSPEMGILGMLFMLGAGFYISMLLTGWDKDGVESCLQVFKNNRNYGLLILLACLF